MTVWISYFWSHLSILIWVWVPMLAFSPYFFSVRCWPLSLLLDASSPNTQRFVLSGELQACVYVPLAWLSSSPLLQCWAPSGLNPLSPTVSWLTGLSKGVEWSSSVYCCFPLLNLLPSGLLCSLNTSAIFFSIQLMGLWLSAASAKYCSQLTYVNLIATTDWG